MIFLVRMIDTIWVKMRDVVWGAFESFWRLMKRHQVVTYSILLLIVIVPYILK